MGTDRLEHGVLGAVALSRNHPSSAHQPSCQVVDDVAIEIGHHQDVKLVWVLHQLVNKTFRGCVWEANIMWDLHHNTHKCTHIYTDRQTGKHTQARRLLCMSADSCYRGMY